MKAGYQNPMILVVSFKVYFYCPFLNYIYDISCFRWTFTYNLKCHLKNGVMNSMLQKDHTRQRKYEPEHQQFPLYNLSLSTLLPPCLILNNIFHLTSTKSADNCQQNISQQSLIFKDEEYITNGGSHDEQCTQPYISKDVNDCQQKNSQPSLSFHGQGT